MKTLSLAALTLMSTSAFATTARVAAHQGNAGITDDTSYRTYFSKVDNGKDSMWFDATGDTLAGAYKADGHSMTIEQSEAGSTAVGYYASLDKNSAYAVNFDIASTKAFVIGGGYGMSDGGNDMAFSGSIGKTADGTSLSISARGRDLSKKEVSAWTADFGYDDGITVDGGYVMGWRFKTDRSKAAVTVGPNLGISSPSEGDTSMTLSLAQVNVAGEFALNDWFGLRGSVLTSLDVVEPIDGGSMDIMSTGVSPAFGASVDFDGADLDFVIDPQSIMNGPYFMTGAASESFAMMMSARFDI